MLEFIGGLAVGLLLYYVAMSLLFAFGGDDGIKYQIKWWLENRREKKARKKKAN